MLTIFYILLILLIIVIGIKSQSKTIILYHNIQHKIQQFKDNKNKENNKDYAGQALAYKKLFSNVNINQSYDKHEAFNLDVEIDKFETALRGESVHTYSKNTQIMHNSSAFSIHNIVKNQQENIGVLGEARYNKQPELEVNAKLPDTLDIHIKYNTAGKLKV